MIAIVDYGSGNVTAIANIYKRLNVPVAFTKTADELGKADRIILPGVGAFDRAMQRLNTSGLRQKLEEMVLGRHTPVLGICVGMQMMASRSDEGKLEGLGWIEGEVKRFDVSEFSQKTHLPHMGWNTAQPRVETGLFEGLQTDARFYFLHSFFFLPRNEHDVIAETHYTVTFASGLRSGNVHGVQFHPEKSHEWGIDLLKNFAVL